LTVAQAGELDRRADEIQAVLTCAPQFRIVAVDATTDTPFGFRLVSRGPGGIRTALAMPAAGRARVAVFDVGGRLVGTAFDGSLSAGSHEIVWDARGSDGVLAPSGVYFLRATAGPNAAVARVVLMH
jgi:hypothetical protein